MVELYFMRAKLRQLAAAVATAAVLTSVMASPASAAPLTNITLTPGTPSTGALLTDYLIGFSAGAYAQCVRVHFGTSPTMTGSLPNAMSFTGAAIDINGVSWTSTSTSDYAQATFGPGDTPNGSTAIRISNVNNPTSDGTYYASIETFVDTGCSSPVSTGIVAFDIHAPT